MSQTLTREQAAALLGVTVESSPLDVRRAWRTWARLAHPDHGGDPAFFGRLRLARDILLAPAGALSVDDREVGEAAPVPRARWAEVLHQPSRAMVGAATVLGILAIGLALLPSAFGLGGGQTVDPAMLAITSGPAAVAAAGWAIFVVNRLLGRRGDVGHRIVALTAAWLPIALAQIVLAAVAGVSLVPVLPLFVLPFVAAVAATNPGAGLWQRPRRAKG
jgi:hypothetical protein